MGRSEEALVLSPEVVKFVQSGVAVAAIGAVVAAKLIGTKAVAAHAMPTATAQAIAERA